MPINIDLPAWDDDRFYHPEDDEEEGEAWKPNPNLDAAKALYEQWRQVVYLINGILSEELDEQGKDEDPEPGFLKMCAEQLVGDMLLVGVKIRSSLLMPYVQKMENAAIIRKAAGDVALGLWNLQVRDDDFEVAEGGLDEDHRVVIRAEIDKFRELYKAWLKTLEKDEWEDEWGLFV